MEYSIKMLHKEREKIVADLKEGKQERLSDLQDIDKAIGWLETLDRADVRQAGRYRLERLPLIEGRGGFCNYHIMMDQEIDSVDTWEEYIGQDGESYLLTGGDDFILAAR